MLLEGSRKNEDIFIPTDEPYGNIVGKLQRKKRSKRNEPNQNEPKYEYILEY